MVILPVVPLKQVSLTTTEEVVGSGFTVSVAGLEVIEAGQFIIFTLYWLPLIARVTPERVKVAEFAPPIFVHGSVPDNTCQ